MQTPKPSGNIDIEELFNWLEQQPELEDIRIQAATTVCEYRPGETTPSARIQCNSAKELATGRKGPLQKLSEVVWVPGRSMRGDAFSTPELDQSLNSVAKLMCISTLWDFFCTIPLFQFSLLGPLAGASFPGAALLSFLLLWASNVAGENSTDRRPRHATRAKWSLAAFILLCSAKTAFSGVGIDLWLGSKASASEYARKELAGPKLAADKAEIKRRETEGQEYQMADQRCTELRSQMSQIDRATNEKQYISLFVEANGSNAAKEADKGLTTSQRKDKYGGVNKIPGICNRRDALLEINREKMSNFIKSVELKSQEINQKPPLAYLEKYEPELFKAHFRSVGDGDIEWVNGTEAVGQAAKQFYANLFAGNLGILGFSLFMLSISIILTGAASIMLYLTGGNPQIQASFTGELKQFRDRRLSEYDNLIKREN